MIAHVAGTPIEELLLPFLAGGGAAVAVAARAFSTALRRDRQRDRRSHPRPAAPGDGVLPEDR
ncbi:MAG TPA: hypothetical protein VFI47_08560 [Acidimicrobiales bacterium]|nr:hypothetical protein [Acidimicrobiales bacterium]